MMSRKIRKIVKTLLVASMPIAFVGGLILYWLLFGYGTTFGVVLIALMIIRVILKEG